MCPLWLITNETFWITLDPAQMGSDELMDRKLRWRSRRFIIDGAETRAKSRALRETLELRDLLGWLEGGESVLFALLVLGCGDLIQLLTGS